MVSLFKITFLLLATLFYCECVFVQSSFWAPLFNPKILNYRVDAKFDPDAGRNNREVFENNYGFRGQNLIADLGNGGSPSVINKNEDFDKVSFYYTYPGAEQNGAK